MSDIVLPPDFSFIPGNKFFAVSRDGRVFNLKANREAAVHRTNGYCFVNVNDNGTTKNYYIHRLVALAFIPVPLEVLEKTDNPEINHKDGNKENNAASNLEWVTSLQNIRHAIENDLASFQKVLARNIETDEIRIHKSKHHVAREYNVCIKKLIRHLDSKMAGMWSKGPWVFKYDDGLDWPDIPEESNIHDRWDRCYGIWVGVLKTGQKCMAARLEDLCIGLGLKYYSVQPEVRADGAEHKALGHTFRYHPLPTEEMLASTKYESKAKFRPMLKIKATTKIKDMAFSTVFDSIRQCSTKLGIPVTTILYALERKNGVVGEYHFERVTA